VHDVTFIVPCYNEEKRLDVDRFAALAREPGIHLAFVNDGSRDRTIDVLRTLEQQPGVSIEVIDLPRNVGKGEAVRAGMQRATARGDRIVGFADADLATPPDELVRLVRVMEGRKAQVVMGARIMLAGTQIKRRAARHYPGRVFAMFASVILKAGFYDTQCGAKLFTNSELLRASLAQPFVSRWIFDVELLGRLLTGGGVMAGLTPEDFLEVPLNTWEDVHGSKLRAGDFAKVGGDLLRVAAQVNAARRARRP
jgi:glycosyltransferase involved in cell wall biosynthesis